ncbi:hypothetical protein [Erythrobacter oryzae]|uniref:hypothetical protein n=1 Tax=Erythrobacter oryzae TaxID=3019556 RepID=UPI0025544AF4|nr:hypothetical protein [Erythrobacter sp. COR-2]
MTNEPVFSSADWITFEAAGRLIDGPNGWYFDLGSRSRPRAEALVSFACEGLVQTRAAKWTIQVEDQPEQDAQEQFRTAFLVLLSHRVKARKDNFDLNFPNHQRIRGAFSFADDVNGHYQVTTLEVNSQGGVRRPHSHRVTALRFSLADIQSLFQLAEADEVRPNVPKASKGGRPTATDWEAAALEMARRYYLGDLKPETPGDVQKQLTAWLAAQDVHPSPSTLHDHAKRYFNAFAAWEAG